MLPGLRLLALCLRSLISGRWDRRVGRGLFYLFRARFRGEFSFVVGSQSVSHFIHKEDVLHLLKVAL